MADKLLHERGGNPVGKNWVDNFVKRTPELRTRWSRPYDHQRAICEDPAAIQRWFDLVETTKQKWGIVDDDIYNFDETGFMMGKILSQLVITASEGYGKKKRIQPGNREWVTVIQGVGASGRRLPPFVVFAGKVLINVWFENLPADWVLEVSPNGWTNNQLALAWLEHFDTHTKRHTVGGYRLLIIDGHESHCSVEFQDLCKKKNIVLLCMPAHSSHLLQPLDVACFGPLKRKYGDAVSALARNRTNYISKETFLPAFRAALEQSITKENIQAGFRAAGLVPHDPQAVLSKLDVVVQTPKQSPRRADTWEAQTPHNAREFEAQSTLIRQRVRNRPGSSASSLDEKVAQLSKGAQQIAHEMTLMREEVAALREALDIANKRKSRKRRYVRTEETLNIGEVQEVLAEQAGSSRGDGESASKRVRGERRCGRCKQTGHNARTCVVEMDSTSNSSDSDN
ncbi:DDE superfamily endonuclease [Pyrenophora tritici-repentis]|nr:DDE superfamily endonuclease [Pyrenophora tritici-repentis]